MFGSKVLAAGLLSATVLISGMPHEVFAAPAGSAGAAAAAAAQAAPSFRSVDEAREGKRIDAATIDLLKQHGTVDAIVVFDGTAGRDAAVNGAGKGKGRAQRILDGLARQHREQKDAVLSGLHGVAVIEAWDQVSLAHVQFTTLSGLLKVANGKGVLGIQQPGTYELGLAQSKAIIRQPAAANLGYYGTGTTVAVLDTGVNYSSGYFGTCPTIPAAGCKVVEAMDFGINDGYQDDNTHGTNVAGIVAGVAPGANILAYDVFRGAGGSSAQDGDMIAAITRTIQMSVTYNVRALNMSIYRKFFQTPSICAFTPDGYANPFTQAFADARAAGILPVVIAGNTPVANGAFRDGISYPGCTAGAVTVGATYDASFGYQNYTEAGCNDNPATVDAVTCFSQSSSSLTILAPGSQITAAGITMSGTSQAAPHVAGAIAVLAAARPRATLDWIVGAMTVSGKPVSDGRFGGRVKPRLDLYAALASLTSDSTQPAFTTLPWHYVPNGGHLATNGTTPVDFQWKASDASALRYDVYVRTNGGAWAYTRTQTADWIEYSLTPGNSYQVKVVAVDAAGNLSPAVTSAVVTPTLFAENSTGVRYSTGWTRVQSSTAVGLNLTYSGTANAWAEVSFTGQNVAWVGTTAPNSGWAWVYADGSHVATINLNGTFDARKVEYSYRFPSAGAHRLKVVVAGTAGHPTVDVDAFVVLN